ncbi:MAG: AAA family ATPase [Candidatus Altiarchaeota archaeon]
MWTQKHKPKTLSEVVGNNTVISSLRSYDWSSPLLLYGATGIGKTTLIECLAADAGMELVSVSDDNIEGAAVLSQTGSLYGGRKLILVDDVDLMKQTAKVEGLLKDARNPVLLITSDLKSKKLGSIKRMCEKIQMRRPHPASISKLLAAICQKEGVRVEGNVLEEISKNVNGDVRSAVNDLESIAEGKAVIKPADLEILSQRDREKDIYQALSTVFFSSDLEEVMRSTYDLSEQPRDVLLWIDENLPSLYDKKSLSDAYGSLSKADIFLGRIASRQYWGFLRYATPLMTAGVNVFKPESRKFAQYRFPSLIISMGRTKKERSIKNSIALKLKPHVHSSTKVISAQYVPLLRALLKNKKATAEELRERFGFDEDETEFLLS